MTTTIRSTLEQHSQLTLVSPQTPVVQYIPVLPPNPQPPQGKNLKQVKIGNLMLFQKGLVKKDDLTSGFLAQPTPFRGFVFPVGTWFEFSSGAPRTATLTNLVTISAIAFPRGAKFCFFNDTTHVTATDSIYPIQWHQTDFYYMDFSLNNKVLHGSMATPMLLPIGMVPETSHLVYDAQENLSKILLAQNTVLQGIEFAHTKDNTGDPEPILLYPNGSIQSGVATENSTRIFLDTDGKLIPIAKSTSLGQ